MAATEHSQEIEELESLLTNPVACRQSCSTVTTQAIRLAAHGHAEEILEIVQRTPEKALFMPLIEGLRLHLGKVISSTGAARSLAIFIAESIRHESNHPFDTHSTA